MEKEKEGLKCKGYKCKERMLAFAWCMDNMRLLLLREQLSFVSPCGFEVRLYVKKKVT